MLLKMETSTFVTGLSGGVHSIVGYLYWAKWCQPDYFADIDPVAIQAEIDQKFFGTTFSGIYAYP